MCVFECRERDLSPTLIILLSKDISIFLQMCLAAGRVVVDADVKSAKHFAATKQAHFAFVRAFVLREKNLLHK